MDTLVESYDSLQEQLATHKQKLKEVDFSIKRLSGSDRSRNNGKTDLNNESNVKARLILTTSANEPRKVSLSNNKDNNRSIKRKSYDDQRYSYKNKRISTFKEHDSADEDMEKPTIKSSVVSSIMPIKTKEDLIKIQNKGANVQRNKRLFGHLLGTLSRFKSDDQLRSSTTQAIHRKELEAKIEINKVEEIKRLSADKKRLEEEKQKQQETIEILEAKMQLSQEFEDWQKNQLKLKKFIRTKSKPFVFYMPKILDENTKKMLEESALAIDELIAKRLQKTKAELEVLKRKEARLNNTEKDDTTKNENKENKQANMNGEAMESDNDELDEEKINANNVQLGVEDEDEVVESSNDTLELKPEINDSINKKEEIENIKESSTDKNNQNLSIDDTKIINTDERTSPK